MDRGSRPWNQGFFFPGTSPCSLDVRCLGLGFLVPGVKDPDPLQKVRDPIFVQFQAVQYHNHRAQELESNQEYAFM